MVVACKNVSCRNLQFVGFCFFFQKKKRIEEKKCGLCEVRTHDLRVISTTLCRLS